MYVVILRDIKDSYEKFSVSNDCVYQAEEWLYFHKGEARATVFIGNAAARTFDFRAGDTGVFPTNSGMFSALNPTAQQLTPGT